MLYTIKRKVGNGYFVITSLQSKKTIFIPVSRNVDHLDFNRLYATIPLLSKFENKFGLILDLYLCLFRV